MTDIGALTRAWRIGTQLVDERKMIERDFMTLDKAVADCLRTNNVYHERDMQLAADLQGEYLTDCTRLETIKTLLVFQIAGLAEPATMAELQQVKVTFDKYLKKILTAPKLESASNAEVAAPLSPISSALEGEMSDVATTTDASVVADDAPPEAAVFAIVGGGRGVRDGEEDDHTGLETGLRQRVAMLREETALFFLNSSQLAVRRAAASLLQGIEKLERQDALQRAMAAAQSPGSPGRSPRRGCAGGGDMWGANYGEASGAEAASPGSVVSRRRSPTKASLPSSPRAAGVVETGEASERPEALWKQFLQGLAPLLREQMTASAAGAGVGGGGEGVVEVVVDRQKLFGLISTSARNLSLWMDERYASKALKLSLQIVSMRFALSSLSATSLLFVSLCMHVYTYIHTYIYAHIHACIHICIHTNIHAYIHICMYT